MANIRTNSHLSIINNHRAFCLFPYPFYLLPFPFCEAGTSTLVENPLQISPFLTNKANFTKSQMNVTKEMATDYEQKDTWWSGKKQSQTKPNKPKFKKAKMNVTVFYTKEYEEMSNWAIYPKRTQFKPNTNPNKPNFKGKICTCVLRLTAGEEINN
jgi:hypothetical protein